jgi:hypothetical protein
MGRRVAGQGRGYLEPHGEMAAPPFKSAPAAPAPRTDAGLDHRRRARPRRGGQRSLCTARPGGGRPAGHGHARGLDGPSCYERRADGRRASSVQWLVWARLAGAPVSALSSCRMRHGAPVRVRPIQPVRAWRGPCRTWPCCAIASRSHSDPASQLRPLRTSHPSSSSCRLDHGVVDAVREPVAALASRRS